MKTFNEKQMGDPWTWCLDMIEKYGISSKMLSDSIEAPRSTVRALYNGSNQAPRYDLLRSILLLCIKLENGERAPWDKGVVKSAPEGRSDEEPDVVEEYDFL